MRRFMLGIVSTLALTCQAPAQEASAAAAGKALKPGENLAAAAGAQSAPVSAPSSQAVMVAAASSQAPAHATSAMSYTEGQKVDLTGTLYSTRDGRIVLKTAPGEIFVVLENQNLWRMEQRAAFGEREFHVKGHVSKYQERYYLSVGRILEKTAKSKSDKDGEDDERPFWERLMFWKNS
ncbi:MAG: hypothetical protein HY303_21715 [Candidatus Wallbacteria bacterium]|nr:hypothetical protein [Candidatus Wallbacteria bacterium]